MQHNNLQSWVWLKYLHKLITTCPYTIHVNQCKEVRAPLSFKRGHLLLRALQAPLFVLASSPLWPFLEPPKRRRPEPLTCSKTFWGYRVSVWEGSRTICHGRLALKALTSLNKESRPFFPRQQSHLECSRFFPLRIQHLEPEGCLSLRS